MAIAPLLALALLAARIEGAASASASAQAGSPSDANDAAAVEPALFVAGTLSLGISDPLEGLQLVYAPRLTLGGGQSAQLLHQASLTGSLRASASQSFRLSESINYGDQDFSPLAPANVGTAPPPPIDRLPPVEVLSVFTSSSALAYTLAISPFMGFSTTAGFSIGGGLGAAARAALPLARTGTLSASLAWGISKLDHLSFALNGALSAPALDQRAESAGAAFGWSHTLSAETSTSLQLGAAWLHNEGQSALQQQPLVPTGGANITHSERAFGHPLSLSLGTAASPSIDPLTGATYLRGTLSASAGWSPVERLGLSLTLSGAHGIGAGEQHDWGAQASLSASLRVRDGTAAALGLRGAWLPPAEVPGQIAGFQWTVFLSISWGDSHSF